jgi:hypothetical protein
MPKRFVKPNAVASHGSHVHLKKVPRPDDRGCVADRAEIKPLRKLRHARGRGILGKPAELTIPKVRRKASAGKSPTPQMSSP